jgi:hypothetical protein
MQYFEGGNNKLYRSRRPSCSRNQGIDPFHERAALRSFEDHKERQSIYVTTEHYETEGYQSNSLSEDICS